MSFLNDLKENIRASKVAIAQKEKQKDKPTIEMRRLTDFGMSTWVSSDDLKIKSVKEIMNNSTSRCVRAFKDATHSAAFAFAFGSFATHTANGAPSPIFVASILGTAGFTVGIFSRLADGPGDEGMYALRSLTGGLLRTAGVIKIPSPE